MLTSPYPEVDGKAQKFSCAWNCYYCPAEPGQPRSYLHDEPAVRRANQNAFDPVLQFTDRCVRLCGSAQENAARARYAWRTHHALADACVMRLLSFTQSCDAGCQRAPGGQG